MRAWPGLGSLVIGASLKLNVGLGLRGEFMRGDHTGHRRGLNAAVLQTYPRGALWGEFDGRGQRGTSPYWRDQRNPKGKGGACNAALPWVLDEQLFCILVRNYTIV